MSPNIVNEYTYSGEYWERTETMSSVITITIDGKQIESCGSTVLFVENGLKPDVEFDTTSHRSREYSLADAAVAASNSG